MDNTTLIAELEKTAAELEQLATQDDEAGNAFEVKTASSASDGAAFISALASSLGVIRDGGQ